MFPSGIASTCPYLIHTKGDELRSSAKQFLDELDERSFLSEQELERVRNLRSLLSSGAARCGAARRGAAPVLEGRELPGHPTALATRRGTE